MVIYFTLTNGESLYTNDYNFKRNYHYAKLFAKTNNTSILYSKEITETHLQPLSKPIYRNATNRVITEREAQLMHSIMFD